MGVVAGDALAGCENAKQPKHEKRADEWVWRWPRSDRIDMMRLGQLFSGGSEHPGGALPAVPRIVTRC